MTDLPKYNEYQNAEIKLYKEYKEYITITKSQDGILNASNEDQRDFIKQLIDGCLFYIDQSTPPDMIIKLIKTEEKWDWKLGEGNSGSVTQSIVNGQPVIVKRFKNKFEGIYISSNYLSLAKKIGIPISKMGDIFNGLQKINLIINMVRMSENGSTDPVTSEVNGYRTHIRFHTPQIIYLKNIDGIYLKSSGSIIRTVGLHKDISEVVLNEKWRSDARNLTLSNAFEVYINHPKKEFSLYKNIPKFIYIDKEYVYHLNFIIPGRRLTEKDKVDLSKVKSTVDELHKHGFCHLDISLRNILVNKKQAELIDFDLMTPIGQASILPLPTDVSSENAINRFQIEMDDDDIGMEKLKVFEIEKSKDEDVIVKPEDSCCQIF